MGKMNVLSVFDGMSCGQIALNRIGVKYDNYFASEVDKYAIQITQKNYPDTIQIGDVTKVKGSDLPEIDLLIGGSPCQGFSFAGKQLNFEDPRSKLFFEFVRLKKELDPKYFMLENVRMKKEYQNIITEYLGVSPVMINSSLVSAQNRVRLYWTNIPGDSGNLFDSFVSQPKDRKILLKDVVFNDALFVGRVVGRRIDKNGVRKDYSNIKPKQRLELRTDGKSGTLTTVQKDNTVLSKEGYSVCMHNLYGGFKEKNHRVFLDKSPTIRTAAGGGHIPSLLLSDKALKYMDRQVKGGRTHWDFKHHSDIKNPKSTSIVANFFKGVPYNVLKDWNCIRKFDPIECERLQTVPDGYTEILEQNKHILYIEEEIDIQGDIICNVRSRIVLEQQQPINTGNSVFYITKDINDTKLQNYQHVNDTRKKYVNIVIEQLGRMEGEQEECVIDITKIGSDMATHSIQTILENSLGLGDIKNELTVKISTGKYLKIILGGHYLSWKKYIILILIKLIIDLKISTYVKPKAYIRFYISSLKELQGNLWKVELSDLKMENIILCSDTQRYKMLGNGWTVDVIAHIFKSLLNG